MIPPRPRRAPGLVAAAAALALAAPVHAQGSGSGTGVRVGVTFGGISRYGLTAEYFDGAYGVDLTLGTFSFHDLSASMVARRYLRSSTPHPYAGIGLWIVTARPPDQRRGIAGVLRVPIGIDWRFAGESHVGAAANLNRLIFVRRADPRDPGPGPRRIIPLPGLYYMYTVAR